MAPPSSPSTVTSCGRVTVRTLLWLLQLKNGEATGTQTPVGILPAIEKLNLEGRDVATADLGRLPIIDTAMTTGDHNRKEHLAQFDGLPEQIWEAYRRVTAASTDAGVRRRHRVA